MRLGFFFGFALDEVDDVGMVDVEDDHLGGAAGLAAGLDDAGEGVEALHEAERAAGGAAAAEIFGRRAQRRKIGAGAAPHLKSMPSVLARVRMESSESCTELMKQAEHWGCVYPVTPNSTFCVCGFQCQFCAVGVGLDAVAADVEPDGRIESGILAEEDVDASSSWKVAPSSGD